MEITRQFVKVPPVTIRIVPQRLKNQRYGCHEGLYYTVLKSCLVEVKNIECESVRRCMYGKLLQFTVLFAILVTLPESCALNAKEVLR